MTILSNNFTQTFSVTVDQSQRLSPCYLAIDANLDECLSDLGGSWTPTLTNALEARRSLEDTLGFFVTSWGIEHFALGVFFVG